MKELILFLVIGVLSRSVLANDSSLRPGDGMVSAEWKNDISDLVLPEDTNGKWSFEHGYISAKMLNEMNADNPGFVPVDESRSVKIGK